MYIHHFIVKASTISFPQEELDCCSKSYRLEHIAPNESENPTAELLNGLSGNCEGAN